MSIMHYVHGASLFDIKQIDLATDRVATEISFA